MRAILPVARHTRNLASVRSAPCPPSPVSLRTILLNDSHRLAVRPLLPGRNWQEIEKIMQIHGDSTTCSMSRGAPRSGPMDYKEARSLMDLWNDPFIFGAIISLLPRSWDQDHLLQQYLEQEKVVGMMALTLPGSREGEEGQFGIALAQEHQGKGFGTASLRWLLSEGFAPPAFDSAANFGEGDSFSRLNGAEMIQGETLTSNVRARQCWSKLGFKEVGEKEGKVHVRITRAEWQESQKASR
ncbi:hypothetical protein BCR35DRAFT_323485 [Leucosporidium creatinivorum]|uniref:N-acetyltransferase domain-containing protein n=1 Tax=Leucosporidium creatinivorum TaxID=106004 RepID=A0A1Y2G180_9BASI|nr:hypothetical protein BCR35DRAFT_323485 [Leucosporidium creatinivorum]